MRTPAKTSARAGETPRIAKNRAFASLHFLPRLLHKRHRAGPFPARRFSAKRRDANVFNARWSSQWSREARPSDPSPG
jgi:hypothetical protein